MARDRDLAAYYRRCRETFLLAQELGCSPCEVEAELRRREARARWDESMRRLNMKVEAPSAPSFREWNSPWMMRD